MPARSRKLALLFLFLGCAGGLAALDCDSADADAARVGDFELVQAAEERALAAAARANEHHGLAALLRVVDAVQHAGGVVGLDQVFNDDHGSTFFPSDPQKSKPDN